MKTKISPRLFRDGWARYAVVMPDWRKHPEWRCPIVLVVPHQQGGLVCPTQMHDPEMCTGCHYQLGLN